MAADLKNRPGRDSRADGQNGERLGGGQSSGGLGDLVKAESMIQLAIVLPAACVIGWLGGSWLDEHFHQGWIGVAGILLGAVAGFLQIFRMASKYLRDSR
jgi:ATP synthase protein I